MPINSSYISQLNYESGITQKFLEVYPSDKGDFKPHEKSMDLKSLAGHIVEMSDWVGYSLLQDVFDWETANYIPTVAEDSAQLIGIHSEKTAKALSVLETVTDEIFHTDWKMCKGSKVFFTMPKIVVLRNFVFNHIIHHRAQLGVYYRLLDIQVPMSYGPTADFQMM